MMGWKRAFWFVLWVCLLAGGCKKEPPQPPAAPEHAVWDEKLSWQAMVELWSDGDPIPNFKLTDQTNQSFRLVDFKDKYIFMTFVYARCPVETMCPLTMVKTQQLQEKWAAAKAAGKTGKKGLQIITVTLDPENDTPQVLRLYGDRFGADYQNWKLATGDPKLVKTGLPSLFNVVALPEGEGIINHSVKAILLSPGLMPKPADGWSWLDNSFDPEKVVQTLITD